MAKVKKTLDKDDFYKFVKSKEFSDLYKEVKNVLNKKININCKIGPLNIEILYYINDYTMESVLWKNFFFPCFIENLYFDQNFISQFDEMQKLGLEFISIEDSDNLSEYFSEIGCYEGNNKSIIKVKNEFNKFKKEFLAVYKKCTDLCSIKKYDIVPEHIIYEIIYNSHNVTEARRELIDNLCYLSVGQH